MTKSKTTRRTTQKMSDPFHFLKLEKVLAKKVVAKLNNHGAMSLYGTGFHRAGAPTVGHIWADQNQIAGAVVGNAIAHQALALALEDQGQLVLRMIVPVERKLRIVPLKCTERRWTGRDLFEIGLHAQQCN